VEAVATRTHTEAAVERLEVSANTVPTHEPEQDGRPMVHAHVVLGLRDGSTRGGQLLRGVVRPTLEVVLRHSPTHLRKRHDPESGLALIDLEA
jgi:predicted DNA-binding protein with PD1-like motif